MRAIIRLMSITFSSLEKNILKSDTPRRGPNSLNNMDTKYRHHDDDDDDDFLDAAALTIAKGAQAAQTIAHGHGLILTDANNLSFRVPLLNSRAVLKRGGIGEFSNGFVFLNNRHVSRNPTAQDSISIEHSGASSSSSKFYISTKRPDVVIEEAREKRFSAQQPHALSRGSRVCIATEHGNIALFTIEGMYGHGDDLDAVDAWIHQANASR